MNQDDELSTGQRVFAGILIVALICGAAYFGQIAGGTVFAKLQKIPEHSVSFLTLFNYWQEYGDNPKVMKFLGPCIVLSAVIPLLAIGAIVAAIFMKAKPELHGSARFANRGEILQAGLLTLEPKKPSIIVGKYNGQFLQFEGQQFVALAAPTRSGKGVGFVVPNLVHYPHSVVVEDVKLENWRLTAGYRSRHGQDTFLFAPDSSEFKSHRWNALSYIRRQREFRVTDTLGIGSILYPTGGKGDDFWNESAQTLFLGLVLYALDTPGLSVSLPTVVQLTAPSDGSTLAAWIKREVTERASGPNPLSQECCTALLNFAGNSDNTAASILSTVLAPLNIFRDPITAAATSGDDFDLRDVRKRKMSIYIGIQPNNLAKYGRLCNLFFSILINENTRQLPEENPALKYQCLLMMDEFCALDRVGIIEKACSYIAGYDIRLALIFQNESQLVKLYEKEGARTMLTNVACQIYFAPRDNNDAKEYSEMLGYYTYKGKSISRHTGKAGMGQSESDQRRALLLPQEVKEIGQKRAIVMLENSKPMLVEKIRWFEEPIFNERVNWPVPDVPKLTVFAGPVIPGSIIKTRDATADEVQKLDGKDFTNSKEILSAIGDKFGISFDSLVDLQAAA